MEILGSKVLGCIKETTSETINVCVICVSMVDKISSEELISLKLFIHNLEEYRLKYIVVGAKVDKIMSSTLDESVSQ